MRQLVPEAVSATLASGQTTVLTVADAENVARYAEAGLRTIAVDRNRVTVTPAPVWLLPPVHQRFRFSAQSAIDTTAVDVVDLWPGGVWSPDAFERLLVSRRVNSWWLRWLPGRETQLARRARNAKPVLACVREFVAARYPGARLAATAVNGSYLWRPRPNSSVDVVAVLHGIPEHTLEHHMSVSLPPAARWAVDGATVTSLDLLVVSESALQEPGRLTGAIGGWTLPDGSPFPYDLERATVATAIRHTLTAGITVDGHDYFAAPDIRPADLLALAYYFTQEASILLAWRTGLTKAAQRLWEANLICRHVESILGTCDSSALEVDATHQASRSQSEPVEPSWLIRTQGWLHGPSRSVLPRTVRRLSRLAHQVTSVPARDRSADDRTVAARLSSDAVLACLREQAVTEAAGGLTDLRSAVERAVGSPGWQQVKRAVRDHPLRADIGTLTSLLRTDPGHVASAVRPGRTHERPSASVVTDELVLAALLWCRFGPRLLALRPLPPSPSLPAVCVADAVRMLTGACLAAVGPSPAAAVGDLWTAHLLEEQW